MIKKAIRKIIFREKADSDSYIKFLRNKGVRIGNNTQIYAPNKTMIDIQRPWLLEIGDNVQITYGVTILSHDYAWAVLKNKYGDVIGSSDKVTIGNNVFIGMNSTILKGVTIGNNVIIGADSLVNKNIPDNVVVAGNPAKIIMSLEEYYKKRKDKYLQEAKNNVIEYHKCYNKVPSKDELYEYLWLFEPRNSNDINNIKKFNETMNLTGNYDFTLKKFESELPVYDNYESFINDCHIKEE